MSADNDLLIILTADHVWSDDKFIETIHKGIERVDDKCIVFVGIHPTYAETGYGYILRDKKGNVIKFVEKPNAELAQHYLESGNYLWNSGIFMFLNSTIIHEFEEHAVDIYNDVRTTIVRSNKHEKTIKLNSAFFCKVRSKSIDYSVMENHRFGKVVAYDGYWCDIGSFQSLYNDMDKNKEGNVILGYVIAVDTTNSYIESENRLVMAIGLDNVVVIDTRDAVLIVDKNQTQKVKELVREMKAKKRAELQYHAKGHARVQVGDDFLNLEPNQHVFIPKKTLHRMENTGDEMVEFI